jgi:hypothetical protein
MVDGIEYSFMIYKIMVHTHKMIMMLSKMKKNKYTVSDARKSKKSKNPPKFPPN